MTGNVTKTEKVLLAATAAFLCLLLSSVIAHRPAAGVTVETARQADAGQDASPGELKIDINTAGAEELTELPGIGDKLAERIIQYRTEYGPFGAIEDIQEVEGIGPGRFSGMEALITVGDPGEETAPDSSGKGVDNG